jgi:ribosomal protein S18 acetylase RimI-like enzyme
VTSARVGTTGPVLRFATLEDVDAVAALHAARISEGFLVTLGPAFLRRLYRRVTLSHGSFLLVADDTRTGDRSVVCGFIAVAENTSALYREYLVRDGAPAAVAAARGIARAPRSVWETLRYGLRSGGDADGTGDGAAEILATAVAADHGRRGIGTHLVRAAVDELERRGVVSARVVTAVGNVAALHAYEGGGFHSGGREVVHRGVAQELLVWP